METNAILSVQPSEVSHPKGRIVAIERDAARARTLRGLLRSDYDAAIVTSADDAIKSILENVPDLVLASPWLPPQDETAITACINNLPAAAHLQIISVPHFIDSEDATDGGTRGVFDYLKRRRALPRPACDLERVREQIDAYLAQARDSRMLMESMEPIDAMVPVALDTATARVLRAANDVHPTPGVEGRLVCGPHGGRTTDRRRARRVASREIPSLWGVKLPWDADVTVIDLSSVGVLLETNVKITTGRTVDLRLLSRYMEVSLPGRATRSDIASADWRGVKYRVGIAFARDLAMPGLEPAAAASAIAPAALADLLARALSEVDSGFAAARGRFEQGLRELLPVREVAIHKSPVISDRGSDSICFRVPGESTQQPVLQAIFDHGYQPSAEEFRLLRAAAKLAAVVLEFAPLGDGAA